jgi:hypothetical protein
MATGQLIEMKDEGRDAFADVLRFYELAKRREWQVRDLPWGELPPIPEAKGSPQSRARRRDMWRSVLTQQLQADMLACDMADTIEEKVFLMQVFYERLIISRFRLIARSSRGTVLEDLCGRLATDDGIHHGAGMAYERVLLQNLSKKMNQKLVDAANRLLPVFAAHALWRPKERAWIGRAMESRDVERLREDLELGVRLAESLGLDVSGVELTIP